eukprot:m.278166 g.278166  ORF g.278166 m.278166 type:complete len:58 (+) comp19792_c1_seq12:247-420(+)
MKPEASLCKLEHNLDSPSEQMGRGGCAHGKGTTSTYQSWTSINSDRDHRSVAAAPFM